MIYAKRATTVKIARAVRPGQIKSRYEVRRSLLDSIYVEMFTENIEGALDLFNFLKLSQETREHYSDLISDVETYCVWDNNTLNVAFHNGRYLTTYLLKREIEYG